MSSLGSNLPFRLFRLCQDQWQTLKRHFFEGESFLEMEDKTGQTFGNVSGHHYRGFERLRSFVSQEKRV